MKVLLTAIIALTLTSAFARPPHERVTADDMMHSIQLGKISAAMLNDLDRDIRSTQKAFDKELGLMGETNDYVEGKIQAGMITMIGDELLRIQEKRANLEGKDELVDADVVPLHERLEEIRKVIEELNI